MIRTARIPPLALFALLAQAAVAAAPPLMGPVTITASNPGDQFIPAVAWDHEHLQWLVVWEQDISGVRQIVSRLVNADGYPLGSSFLISETALDQTDPDVVYDPGHDRYMVVWVSQFSATDSDIAGRFIPWYGPVDTLMPFNIEYPSSLQFAPALEYAPFPVDEYFLVWENVVDFDPATIRAKRLYPDTGSEVGPSFEVVGDATYDRRNPRLAWNADAGRYLVAYERFEGSAEEDVYAASVSFTGTVFSPDLGLAGYAPEENQIDVAACHGSWMVVWKGGTGAGAQVFARPVAGDLTLGSTANLSVPFGDDRWPSIGCNPHGYDFFVAWERVFSNLHSGVKGSFLNADGTGAEAFSIRDQSAGNVLDYTRPAVSIGDGAYRAFVVWETDREDLVHQDLAGRWVDMALFSDNFESGNLSRWSATAP